MEEWEENIREGDMLASGSEDKGNRSGTVLGFIPASIIRRVGCFVIDCTIVFILNVIVLISVLAILIIFSGKLSALRFFIVQGRWSYHIVYYSPAYLFALLEAMATLFYFIFFTVKFSASPGKKILGCKVVSTQSNPLSLKTGLYRELLAIGPVVGLLFCSYILNIYGTIRIASVLPMIFALLYLVVNMTIMGFDRLQHRALHDYLMQTYVIQHDF